MIKAIFFDVDGTLLSHRSGTVPASTRAALSSLQKQGIRCVLATGRHLNELDAMPVRDIAFDDYLLINGQLCLDSQRRFAWDSPITGAALEAIISLFRANVFPMVLLNPHRLYINFINDHVIAAQQAIATALPEVGVYAGEPIYMAAAYIGEDQIPELKRLLPSFSIMRWHEYAVDILPPDTGKMAGVARYIQENGIAREETMAFGDADNDIDMLRFVGTGVAMGNAFEETKACADYVTSDVDDHGIARALAHFGLLPRECADYRFVPAQAHHLPSVYALIDQRIRWMDEMGIRQWNVTGYWLRYPQEYYVRLMQAGQLYVLLDGNESDGNEKVLGAAALLETDPHWAGFEGDSACYLHHFVTDVHAGGVGSIILQKAESIARAAGKACLRLDCSDSNPRLNRYYEEAGYHITGRCTDGPYSGNRREKAL